MTRSPVYCALIEIEPLDGCELDPAETAGASVRCYIPAVDTECAIILLTNTLSEMKMALVETEWCVDYDNTEWENPVNKAEEAFVANARESGTIVFGTFHSWGHDVPDLAKPSGEPKSPIALFLTSISNAATALIAAITSAVYKPRELEKAYRTVRLAGGLTFGLTLMLFEKLVDGYLCSRPAIFNSIEILITLTLITALCVSITTQFSMNAMLSNARWTRSLPSPG